MDFRVERRCERAREYASLALDGELSQFELALLNAHIQQCPPCRSYHVGLVATTERLRNAPLERLEHPIVLPRRQRVSFRTVQVGLAAALVVTAVGLGSLLSSIGSTDSSQPNASLPTSGESRVFQDIRRARLQEVAFRPSAPGGLDTDRI